MAAASARGVALIDVLPAMALAALVSATTIPVVAGTLEHERARVGAHYVAARLMHAQLRRFGVARSSRSGSSSAPPTHSCSCSRTETATACYAGYRDRGGPANRASRLDRRTRAGVRSVSTSACSTPAARCGSRPGSDPLRIGSTSLISCSPTGSLTAERCTSARRAVRNSPFASPAAPDGCVSCTTIRSATVAAMTHAADRRRAGAGPLTQPGGLAKPSFGPAARPHRQHRAFGALVESGARLRPGRRAELQLVRPARSGNRSCPAAWNDARSIALQPLCYRGAIAFESTP